MSNKYGNFLTMFLVVLIVAILGILGLIGIGTMFLIVICACVVSSCVEESEIKNENKYK